ncbi:MAG: phosphoribosyl-AMP cyclohydrolase [Patescibacteria group bacterium]
MQVLYPNFEKRDGLVTVVAQEASTGQILMVASTDPAGFEETLRIGKAVYYSTSRKERWMKGETSDNTQEVVGVLVDCDGDAVIYLVQQRGEGACHTGAESCFYRNVVAGAFVGEAPRAGKKEVLHFVDIEVHERFGR